MKPWQGGWNRIEPKQPYEATVFNSSKLPRRYSRLSSHLRKRPQVGRDNSAFHDLRLRTSALTLTLRFCKVFKLSA